MKPPQFIKSLLGLLCLGTTLLHAEDLYVRAGNTSGARTGTDWNNAWNGFSDIKWGDGAGRVGPGDTLWIAGGTYTSTLHIGASGTAAAPIRIKRVLASDAVPAAAAGWNSAFDSQVVVNAPGACIYFANGIGSYMEIDGRVKSGIRVNYQNGGSGVEIDGSGNFTNIAYRYIEAAGPGPITQVADTRGFDLTIAGTLTNITISNCEAHHSDTLIQVTQSWNLVIEYTDLHHAGAVNAATYHPNTIYLGTVNNATIRYNILREIDVEGLFFGDPGNNGVQIYGNLFYQGSSPRNSGRGIEFDNSANSSNVLIYNNTFVDLPLPGVSFNNGQSHPGAVVRNNIFWNCNASYASAAHDYNFYSGSSNYSEPNGIAGGSTSPFVNAAAYDYHIVSTLASNKPRNEGVNLGAPYNYDRDGNLRGADGVWDIGAYEYNAGGSPPPPPPANTAPTIGTIANQSTTSGTPVGPIAFTVGDAETAAGSLAVSGSSSNTTLLPASAIVFGGSGANRTVTLSPAAGQTGTATVTITVSDGALTAARSFSLTVTTASPPPPANTAPTIGTIADQTTTDGTAVGPIAFIIGDAETSAGSLLLSGASSNTALLPASAIVFGGSGANRTVTLSPVAGQTGNATVSITVSDGALSAVRSFTLSVTAGTTPPPPPPPSGNGLVAAYAFDDAAGATAADASGNGNTGQIQGASWSASGRFGSALSFNGSSNLVYVPNSSSLTLGSAMTIQAWVRPSASLSGWRTIVQKEVDAYFLHASSSTAMTPAAGGIFNGGASWSTAPSPIAANTWTHLAVTYDGATVRLYVNGAQVSSKAQTGTLQANSNALRIGGNAPYGEYFQGLIDEVRIYNRALSAAEIQADMTTPVSGIVTPPPPPPNTAPSLTAIADQTIITGNSTGALAFTVSDAETAAGSLAVSAVSSNATLVPAANLVLGGSGASRTLTVTPAAGLTGTATITVSVSDGALSASRSFALTVNPPPNTAPTISSVANIALVTGTSSGPLAFTVGDAETAAGSLVLSASSSNAALLPVSAIVFGGSGANRTVSVTPVAGLTGSVTVGITVSDGSASASTSFVVTVNPPPNTAPALTAIANQTIIAGSSTGPLAFTISDAETVAGSLAVSAASSNATLVPASGLALGGSGANRTLTVTPAAGQTGSATITVSVSDGALSASRSFTLTVNPPPNTAPTISSVGNITLAPGESSSALAFTIGDAETAAGSLVLSASSSNAALLPVSAIVFGGSGANRTVTVTPAAGQTGTATVTVTVSDGSLSASMQFIVSVIASAAPVIGGVSDQVTAIDTPVGPIAIALSDGDTDPAKLTLSAVSDNTALVPASGLVLGGSGSGRTLTVTPASGRTGLANITLTVSDGANSDTRSFLIVVNAPARRGLVAAYSFDEGSGTRAGDSSGYGHHGDLRGAVWTGAGKFGGALSFNGTNSFVEVPGSAALNLGSRMTLEAWVLPTASQSGWRTIVQKEVASYFLHASNSGGALRPAGGGIFGGKKTWSSTNSSIPVGSWTHLAVTYDGATIRLYRNGAQIASRAQTGAIQANSNSLRIGGNVPYGEFFRGTIDEVRIYNRALSAAEISSDMAAPIGSAADVNAWSQADIGSVGLAGSATADPSAGTITASGSGAGIAGTADAFRFVYRPLEGDGTVEARLDSLAAAQPGAKAGVMIRGALTASAAKVFAFVDPASSTAVQVRASDGATASATAAPAQRWVRLVRVGGTIVAMTSPDGVAWTAAGTYNVPMNAQVFAGFAVTAGDNTKLASAVFAEPFIE